MESTSQTVISKLNSIIDTLTGVKTNTDKIPGVITTLNSVKSQTDNISAVKTQTDKIPTLQTTANNIKSSTDNIGAVKTQTDKIPTLQTTANNIKSQTDNISAIKSQTDSISTVKTQTDKIGSMQTTLNTVKSQTDNITAIKTKVDSLGSGGGGSILDGISLLNAGTRVGWQISTWSTGNKEASIESHDDTALAFLYNGVGDIYLGPAHYSSSGTGPYGISASRLGLEIGKVYVLTMTISNNVGYYKLYDTAGNVLVSENHDYYNALMIHHEGESTSGLPKVFALY